MKPIFQAFVAALLVFGLAFLGGYAIAAYDPDKELKKYEQYLNSRD